MATLLSPAYPIKTGIRWALMAHTVALFFFSTIPLGIHFNNVSIEYINGREFPGNDTFLPGPIGYGAIFDLQASNPISNAMFPLNQWLADGLLVSSILDLVASVCNVGCSSSYIDVISFFP